jgi:hypothetical protein
MRKKSSGALSFVFLSSVSGQQHHSLADFFCSVRSAAKSFLLRRYLNATASAADRALDVVQNSEQRMEKRALWHGGVTVSEGGKRVHDRS